MSILRIKIARLIRFPS